MARKFYGFLNGRARARRRLKEQMRRQFSALVQTDRNRTEGIFDADWYLSTYPDIRDAGFEPVYHYLTHGAAENRNPGPHFETAFYREIYADVAEAGANPLLHYLQFGRQEGRAPNPRVYQPPSRDAGYAVVKDFELSNMREAAVLVTHASAGRLKPHVLPYVKLFARNGIAVMLVVVADRPVDFLAGELAAAAGIMVRENVGYDFGAWAQGIRLFPELWGVQILYITNDSILPSSDAARFGVLIGRVRASDADIVGLTASQEYGWHLQSYFLAVKAEALSSWTFQFFVRDIRLLEDKDQVIRAYEVPFAGRMQAAGLSVETLFDSPYAANPTLFGWRELIAAGFPFVKLLLLRGRFPQADTEGWEDLLGMAGFDVGLAKATILASEINVPAGAATGLLANPKPFETVSSDRPLNVAYVGPWNYDNGLGQASRELLSALRRTGHRLNVYPIAKPFHVHRLISPPVAATDFAGRPDVVIVHLNPDSWHLMMPDQRDMVRSAKRRIGYWVWETDTLPPAWSTDLGSVDRIWAPTRYCADVFETEVEVPVDVVPHPVRVPAHKPKSRALLQKFGIADDKRVILYVFDGASYLIRKNPVALIRSFAKSGLESRGWCLLLKTKHLFDRRDAGEELLAAAKETPGVVIVDASLDAENLTSLLNAADIYASPHCSEGFGLTIAEAMALGKLVVATDFSGPRDFLDAATGYPVKADAWTLTEDHGHYLTGHGWARIDEDALAVALRRAVGDIEAGNVSIGRAAHDAIAAKLSYDVVATTIDVSLKAVIADSVVKARAVPLPPPPPNLPRINLSGGRDFRSVGPSEGIVPVRLEPDLSWDSQLPEAGRGDWYFFAPADAKMAPDAFELTRAAIAARPDVVLFYSDDVSPAAHPLDGVRLKPDFDATLIAVQDYIGVPVIARASLVLELGGLDVNRGTAALYDLVLRVSEMGGVARIPHVLIGHARARTAVTPEQRRDVLRAIPRYARYDIENGERDGSTRMVRRFEPDGFEPVTIVIPTRRSRIPGRDGTYIERLLARLVDTDWPMDRLTVLIGDDIEEPANWESRVWPFALRRISTPRPKGEPFNYAAKMNRLWRAAKDEQIVLMNDDVVPQGPGWLKALQTFALDQSVGGVGAALFYETGAIQHAGIFPSLRIAVHAWAGMAADAKTYQDWAFVQREWSMVTGAVFATRRSAMSRINGFEERFTIEFNDIDLCLRLRTLGYRIVYTPEAGFVHAEKASRGSAPPPAEDIALFLSRWSAWLEQDPSSHPAYAADRVDIVPMVRRDAWYAA